MEDTTSLQVLPQELKPWDQLLNPMKSSLHQLWGSQSYISVSAASYLDSSFQSGDRWRTIFCQSKQ
jgi:hypothetical protein